MSVATDDRGVERFQNRDDFVRRVSVSSDFCLDAWLELCELAGHQTLVNLSHTPGGEQSCVAVLSNEVSAGIVAVVFLDPFIHRSDSRFLTLQQLKKTAATILSPVVFPT